MKREPRQIWYRMRRLKLGGKPVGRWHYTCVEGTNKKTMRKQAKVALCTSHGTTPLDPWGGPFDIEETAPPERPYFLGYFGRKVFAEGFVPGEERCA